MSHAASVSDSAWIVGPRYDLFFFSTIWLLPLLVAAPVLFDDVGLGRAFFYIWIYHLLIRLPHFAAMFRVTYLRGTQRDHYRQHWVRYFAVPALILIVYGIPLLSPAGYATPFGTAITTIAYIWGYQHIGMQNYGVLQIYRLRSGGLQDRAGSRLEKTVLYSIILSVAARNHLGAIAAFLGWPGFDAGGAEVLLGGVGALLVAAYFVHLYRSGCFSGPLVAYFVVAVIAMVRWPIYDDLPAGSWFLVFNGHHSVAYLGLLFLMDWNQKSAGRVLTFAAGAPAFLRFHASLVAAALGLVFVTVVYATVKANLSPGGYTGSSLEVLLGFFVMHYYVEALVWKFRHAHNRETTLPLLRQPSPA